MTDTTDTSKRRRIALSPTADELERLQRAAGRQPLSSWVLWAALAMADRVVPEPNPNPNPNPAPGRRD